METQKQLLEKHRDLLDQKYRDKYPNGLFQLQRRYGDYGCEHKSYPPSVFCIHWCPERNTSSYSRRGITTEFYFKDTSINKRGVTQENYRNCCFGYCTSYDNINSLIKSANKFDFPKELIDAFLQRYNNRKQEGFKT